ncbi:hypothetical protein O6H91_02G138200 [Diphasiastrum complanatum]|uniref:Uncharacterized protein n=1 Tax=Diphasiastrum complanatum TaxID=34168 RepID=A0ACC2EKV0_DIPCM|nr:hypothetical protein O6H91_02G138200 [Diphasiastrum complanatum]
MLIRVETKSYHVHKPISHVLPTAVVRFQQQGLGRPSTGFSGLGARHRRGLQLHHRFQQQGSARPSTHPSFQRTMHRQAVVVRYFQPHHPISESAPNRAFNSACSGIFRALEGSSRFQRPSGA